MPGTANTFQNVALNNSSNDTLKCSKNEACVCLPETLSFLAVEFSSIAVVASNHLGIDNPNSSLPSPLAPGTAGIFFEVDWAVGTGRLYSPFVRADLVIKIKTKIKHKREKGQSKADSESDSERTKGESDFTLLSLHVNVSKAVVRRRTLLQIK